MDTRHRQHGVAFLRNLQGFAALCKTKNDFKLFTNLVETMPISIQDIRDHSYRNTKKTKTSWSCGECGKKFTSKNGLAGHEEQCRRDPEPSEDEAASDAEVSENPAQAKKTVKTQIKVKGGKSRMEKCIFCKKERVRIISHYLVAHKIDYDLFVKNIMGNNLNDTTCPQCNVDYKTKTILNNHFRQYHSIIVS